MGANSSTTRGRGNGIALLGGTGLVLCGTSLQQAAGRTCFPATATVTSATHSCSFVGRTTASAPATRVMLSIYAAVLRDLAFLEDEPFYLVGATRAGGIDDVDATERTSQVPPGSGRLTLAMGAVPSGWRTTSSNLAPGIYVKADHDPLSLAPLMWQGDSIADVRCYGRMARDQPASWGIGREERMEPVEGPQAQAMRDLLVTTASYEDRNPRLFD